MKEFLVHNPCFDKLSTSKSSVAALDLANNDPVPPQSLLEVVGGNQKITPSEVYQEPGNSSCDNQQIFNEIFTDSAL